MEKSVVVFHIWLFGTPKEEDVGTHYPSKKVVAGVYKNLNFKRKNIFDLVEIVGIETGVLLGI